MIFNIESLDNIELSFLQKAGRENVENEIILTGKEVSDFVNVRFLPDIIQTGINLPSESRIYKHSITFNLKLDSNEKVFMNGYQSWTETREFAVDDKIRKYSQLFFPLLEKYCLTQYGDYNFVEYSQKKGELHGFSYCYIRHEDGSITLIGSLNERNGFTVFRYSADNGQFTFIKELEGVVLSGEHDLISAAVLHGDENDVFDRYFKMLGVELSVSDNCTGWTSWYNYYENITEEIILDNLKNFSELKTPFNCFQIDDGYQKAVGDWLDIKDTFPNGMKKIAGSIKDAGYAPGLWLAPFACEEKSDIFKLHSDWVLKDENGDFVRGGSNWSGFYALDLYNEEVRDYLRNVFKVVVDEWGFNILKLDFLYAVCLIPQHGKSRGEVMSDAVDFLKDIAGAAEILGCGVPLMPAFGKFEYCRIGCDVGLEWVNVIHEKLVHRERISTFNALNDSLGRVHLNKRGFINDPDVFFLRNDNIKLTDTEKYTVFLVNNLAGGLLFTSDNIANYDNDTLSLFNSMFPFLDKEIISITHDRLLYKICFRISNRGIYTAFVNLSDKKRKVTLESGGLYYSHRGFIKGGQSLFLKKRESVCCRRIESREEIAGSTGHLFPGSDVAEFKVSGDGYIIRLDEKAVNRSTIFFTVPGECSKVIVNGEESPVINVFGFKVGIFSS